MDELMPERPFDEWIWELDGAAATEASRIAAWAPLPALDDPDWIPVDSSLPETSGLTKDVLGLELGTVLAKRLVVGIELVGLANRLRAPKPFGTGSWEWSRKEAGPVTAWMPMPEYEP